MNNVNNCYNVYIDIPQNDQLMYFKVSVYKNSTLYFTYDSNEYNKTYIYNFSLFNGTIWKRIPNNGLIDSKSFIKIAIKNINDSDNNFVYRYQFYNDNITTQQKQLVVPAQNSNVDNDLNFKIYIPQLLTTYNPILYWKKSTDLDNQNVKYKIQLYDADNLVATYQNIKSDQQYIQYSITDIKFTNETIYKWRICSQDEFGQYSEWTDFYCFKIINLLQFNTLVQKRFFDDFRAYVYVTVKNQLLNHLITVQNVFDNDLLSFVHVTVNDQLLFFKVYCQNGNINHIGFYVHVTIFDQLLYMKSLVQREYYNPFNSFVYIDNSSRQLNFKLNVIILLKGKILVTKRYTTDDDHSLQQKLHITTKSDLFLSSVVGRRLVSDDNSILFYIQVKKKYYKPFYVTLYDQNEDEIQTDNRIKIYDADHVQIIPLDLNEMVQKVYPYVQNGINNQLIIYDQAGNIITKVYDIDGNRIIPYDNQNKIKNWLQNKTYTAKYQYYNQDIKYKYRFDNSDSEQLIYETSNTTLTMPINYSGEWTLSIIPYLNNKPLFNGIYKDTIYTNILPQACQPPFFIDGIFINNETVIQNSLPVFSFTPVNNVDNDEIKYHLMISQDRDFNTTNVDVYLNQSNSTISYQFKSQQRLEQQGIYYIYLATCDYNQEQLKSQIRSNQVLFTYNFNYDIMRCKCQVVQYEWFAMGIKMMVRGLLQLKQRILVYIWSQNEKDWDKNDLKGILHIYKELVEDPNNDLYNTIFVKYCLTNDLPLSVQIKKLSWDIGFRIDLTEGYNSDFNNKMYVYKGYTQDDIYTQEEKQNKGWKLKLGVQTIHYEYADLQPFRVVVRRVFNSDVLKGTCQVWNQLFPPKANHSLIYFSVAVSNFVYASRLLYHKLNIYYPQPPVVVVKSNIEQKKWQTNYKAEYYLSLKQQSKLQFMYYEYIVDDQETVKLWEDYKTTISNVKIDLRSAISDKQTGKFYFHVRSVNVKNVKSSYITTYAIYYNNKVDAPIPLTVNGNIVTGNQQPVVNYNQQITIYWSEIIDEIDIGDHITYELQISQTSMFEQLDYSDTNISSTTYTVPSKTLSPALYYFRVRAFDQNQYSDWSIIAMFYVNKAPEAPTKLYVKNIS